MIPPAEEATDIFSLSDQVLADRLEFVQEIGFGNWGSVWLCKPKTTSTKGGKEPLKVAVKVVHRSKTTTTAARVKSLWNEMKIVRLFKEDPHPSIVPFHSFIITPSYALITMEYLPELIPVEVPEPKAKEWFRSLLSGVQFLHEHGVVHNDIKPANILLSTSLIPVLVDFGFAERYELKSSKAFQSNLTYGTPEYLSPERARGLPHDTRKSDVWSLGVTFFEILIGRTPFEHVEGEQFETKEDLEKYWARTLRGKWVGKWTMSRAIEKLLKRMIQPNADLRCVTADAIEDPYWTSIETPSSSLGSSHRKATSIASTALSTSFDKLLNQSLSKENTPAHPSTTAAKESKGSKLIDIVSPWSSRRPSKSDRKKSQNVAKNQLPIMGPASHTKMALGTKTNANANTATAPGTSTATAKPAVPPKPATGRAPLQTKTGPGATKRDKENAGAGVGAGSPGVRAAGGALASTHASRAMNITPARSQSSIKDRPRTKTLIQEATANAGTKRGVLGARTPPAPLQSREGRAARVPVYTSSSSGKENAGPSPRYRAISGAGKKAGGPKTPAKVAPKETSKAKGKATPSGKDESSVYEEGKTMGSVRDRMRDWEREKERLRSLARYDMVDSSESAREEVPVVKKAAEKVEEGPSFGSVSDRMRDWERERERLRAMKFVTDTEADTEKEKTEQEQETTEEDLDMKSLEFERPSMESVRDRMRDWEREKQKMREIEREKELDLDPDMEGDESLGEVQIGFRVSMQPSRGRPEALSGRSVEGLTDASFAFERSNNASKILSDSLPPTPLSPVMDFTLAQDTLPRPVDSTEDSVNESSLNLSQFTHGLKMSIGKTVRLYKSSTLSHLSRGHKSTSAAMQRQDLSMPSDNTLKSNGSREGTTSTQASMLPVLRPSTGNERVGADNRADRMTMWIENVEKVVEDARQNFASSSVKPLAPLPVAPPSRSASHCRTTSQAQSNLSSRRPRKILAASQIFEQDGSPRKTSKERPVAADESVISASSSMYRAANASSFFARGMSSESFVPKENPQISMLSAFSSTLPTIPSESEGENIRVFKKSTPLCPPMTRRATVSGLSPDKVIENTVAEPESPSKRRTKSKSQSDLLSRPISPVSRLQSELERLSQPPPPLRLDAVLDKSLFITEHRTPTIQVCEMMDRPVPATPSSSIAWSKVDDSLVASPHVVQPYASRAPSPLLQSPNTRKRTEGVYDRFLMATSGVKRVGRGYQSELAVPVDSGPLSLSRSLGPDGAIPKASPKMFLSARKSAMPPPVSSEDMVDERRAKSVDEIGVMQTFSGVSSAPLTRDPRTKTVKNVRKALKAMVTGRAVSVKSSTGRAVHA